MKGKVIGKLEIEFGFSSSISFARFHNLGDVKGFYTFNDKRLFSKVEIDFVFSKYLPSNPQHIEFKDIFRGVADNYEKWLVDTMVIHYLQYYNIIGIPNEISEEEIRKQIAKHVEDHLDELNVR